MDLQGPLSSTGKSLVKIRILPTAQATVLHGRWRRQLALEQHGDGYASSALTIASIEREFTMMVMKDQMLRPIATIYFCLAWHPIVSSSLDGMKISKR